MNQITRTYIDAHIKERKRRLFFSNGSEMVKTWPEGVWGMCGCWIKVEAESKIMKQKFYLFRLNFSSVFIFFLMISNQNNWVLVDME
jgi:hypothetical protein